MIDVNQISKLRSELGIPTGPVIGDTPSLEISPVELKHLAENLDVLTAQEFSSHRPFIGPLIVGIKMAICVIFKPIINVVMGRQWALNYYTYQNTALIAQMAAKIIDLESRLERLERKGG